MCSFLLFMEIISGSLAFLHTWQCCAWPYATKLVDHPWRSRGCNSLSLWGEQEDCTNAWSHREGGGRTSCRWFLFSEQSLQPSPSREENLHSVGSKLSWCGWWHKLGVSLSTVPRRAAGLSVKSSLICGITLDRLIHSHRPRDLHMITNGWAMNGLDLMKTVSYVYLPAQNWHGIIWLSLF